MKLSTAQVERFLQRPDPTVAVVLIYGPDEGLVRERLERLVKNVLDDPHDPFRLTEIDSDALRGEPARLADEARALTLSGGRRVVRVRRASDQVSAACRALLALDAIEALVVLEAGELSPASSLRRLIEGTPKAAAVPCYRDQGRDLAGLIDRLLADHGLEAEADARAYLVDHLGADRGVTRAEIAKLVLYLGAQPDGDRSARHKVTLEDVARSVGDSAALGLDELVDAASLGDLAQLERVLDRLLGEGQPPVRIVRALANHVVRMHRFALQIERGQPVERIIDQARPPVHFRRKDKLRTALHRWSASRLASALGRLIEAELACKTTGWPAELICRDAALAIARQASKSA